MTLSANLRTDQAPLLSVRDLKKHYLTHQPLLGRLAGKSQGFSVKAVDGISFDIPRGQTLSLVGESGCGKSSVARLIMGLSQPTDGKIFFDHVDISLEAAGKPAPLRKRMQMIFQDPYASLNPRWRVRDIIGEPLRQHKLIADKQELHREVDRLLEFVGLSAAVGDLFPYALSGGQRQRISIARAISTKPDFLVCDEPTSALDVSVQAQILNLMRDMQRELGLTYLFISHDLAVVNFISDYVGVMYLGRLVELAPAASLFSNPQHPYTKLLLDTIPRLESAEHEREPVSGEMPNPIDPPSGCVFHPRCKFAASICSSDNPVIRRLPNETLAACHFPGVATAEMTAHRHVANGR